MSRKRTAASPEGRFSSFSSFFTEIRLEKRLLKGIVSKKLELLPRRVLETSNFHVRRPKIISSITLRYRMVKLTTMPLSKRKPFPKQKAEDTKSKLQIWIARRRYLATSYEISI